jgi:hypothetical protein
MSFFQNRGPEGKTVPLWGLVAVGGERYKERVQDGEYGGNIWYSCMKMKKLDLLKLFQESGEGG